MRGRAAPRRRLPPPPDEYRRAPGWSTQLCRDTPGLSRFSRHLQMPFPRIFLHLIVRQSGGGKCVETAFEDVARTWKAQECPYIIEYSTRVLDDIRRAVVEAFFRSEERRRVKQCRPS